METKAESLHAIRELAEARHEAAKWEVWIAEEAMKNLMDHLNECVQEAASTRSELEAVEGRLKEVEQNHNKPQPREGGTDGPV